MCIGMVVLVVVLLLVVVLMLLLLLVMECPTVALQQNTDETFISCVFDYIVSKSVCVCA